MDQLIRFRCECGKKLKATRDLIGKKVRCTNCVQTHHVPESDHLPPKKRESSPKQTDSTKPKTTTQGESKVNKPKPSVIPKKTSLVIADEMAAKEPSLLPTNDDDSDSRFKLDPKFDPEPSETPLNPVSDIEFEFYALDIDTGRATTSPHLQLPSPQRSTNKSKLILSITATTAVLLLLFGIGWFALGDSSYPQEFSEQPEVRNYVNKTEEFRKSQRTLKVASEAYVKSKSPTAQEREQIEAFNRSIEPLADEQTKLEEALELFKASQHEKARSALVTATRTLDQKIPELQTKAKAFSSKLR